MHTNLATALLIASVLPDAHGWLFEREPSPEPRVLLHNIERQDAHSLSQNLQQSHATKRQDGQLEVPLYNERSFYFMNISLGSPSQNMRVQLDTGSSDLWVNTQQGRQTICNSQLFGQCQSGVYNANSSRSYTYLNSDFNISYASGRRVLGDYVADWLSIGEELQMKQFDFGVGYRASMQNGIMGIGYPKNEAIVQHGGQPYPNFPQRLVDDGHINTMAYSLWLNDLHASSGSILFGGIDTAKYTDDLVTVPVRPGSPRFIISLSGVGQNGNPTSISGNIDIDALLDSGSTYTYLPDDLTNDIYRTVGADLVNVTNFPGGLKAAVIDCSEADNDRVFNFQFARNFALQVSMSELVQRESNIEDAKCVFGILPVSDNAEQVAVIGDTVLRSAYVVYDLQNDQISLGQTVFNATGENIVEIDRAGVLNTTGVASVKGDVPSAAARTFHTSLSFIAVVAFLAWQVLSWIFLSGAHSDLELRCEDKTWKVHKVFLCSQSEWFSKACDGRFKEGQTGVIELHDEHVEAIEAMLTYIYTKDYSDRSSLRQQVTWQARPALFNARVFALAEKYFIHDLEALAAKKYKECMYRTGYNDLMESAMELYASASDPDMHLRKTIISAIFRYIDTFFSTPRGIEALRKAAETHPGLAADMAEAFRQRALQEKNRNHKTSVCQD